MTTNKEESLVVADAQSITNGSAEIPAWLRNDELAMTNAGREQLTAKDMTLPRLKLAQKGSPEIEEGNAKFIPELRQGQFFNTLTKEVYGKKLLVTPLFVKKSRRLFGPVDQGSPTLCFSENSETGGRISPKSCAACPKSRFTWNAEKNKNNKPDCTLFYSYIVIIHLDNRRFMPVILSLKSTAIEAAQKWNSYMNLRGVATFAGVYTVESFLDTKGGTTFQNLKVDNAGWITPQLMEDVKSLFKSLEDRAATEMSAAETVEGAEVIEETEEVPF